MERRASHKIASTIASDKMTVTPMFCFIVPNSSSFIGMGPVCRTRAWNRVSSFSPDAMFEIASVAARPGRNAVKSSIGWT